MLLKLLRNGLGYLIIFISFFIPINRLSRSTEDQKWADDMSRTLSLYQFNACPFCLKTRRAFKRLGLNIETRNAMKNPSRADLLAGGGVIKVPCLRIEDNDETIWMYESGDIIQYMQQRFGDVRQPVT